MRVARNPPAIIEAALRLPGAILIGQPEHDEHLSWEVGIQHHRAHARFLNLFGRSDDPWLYFRHPDVELVRATPDRDVQPSDVSPDHWSKTPVELHDAWHVGLVESSHRFVLSKQARKAQARVNGFVGANGFLQFHRAATALITEGVTLDYTNLPNHPQLSASGLVVAARWIGHRLYVLDDGVLVVTSATTEAAMIAKMRPALDAATRRVRELTRSQQ